jgi:hypothetical protein
MHKLQKVGKIIRTTTENISVMIMKKYSTQSLEKEEEEDDDNKVRTRI